MVTNVYGFTNDAVSTLAAGITAASLSLQITGGGGSLFPTTGTGRVFWATLIKSGAPTVKERIIVLARAGDNCTSILRGQDGTSAQSWSAGDSIALQNNAGALGSFMQAPQVQAFGANYAPDTGAVNAYIGVLAPAINGHVVGMPILMFANHSNSGPSTFSDGIGVGNLLTSDGDALIAGDIVSGGFYWVVWNGTNFRLAGVDHPAFTQIHGVLSNAQVPIGAVLQYEASLIIAATQISGALVGTQIAASVALAGSPTTTTQASGNSSTRLATTAFVNPNSSVGSITGYRVNPDGSMEQWGQVNVTNAATVPIDVAITFPTTFPGGIQGVYPVANRRIAGASQAVDGSNFASQLTQSGATITIDNNGAGHFIASWRALGW